MRKQRALHCSFCGKSQHDVRSLIAGPKVFICDECVDVCIEVLGVSRAWCDRQLANLKRLRQQAPADESKQAVSEPEPTSRRAGWLRRLWR